MKRIFLVIIGILIAGIAYTTIGKTAPNSEPAAKPAVRSPRSKSDKVAVFAGGCFWSLESYFEKIPNGIVDVVSGYSGGTSNNPTYENYTLGNHREAVQVTYDPNVISYGELTEYFFRHIDPTDAGGAFYDRGANYTSAVFYENDEEKAIAEKVITVLEKEKIFNKPIVTPILPVATFWPAEEYHQNYAANNSVRYAAYRAGSGRDAFLKKTWEGKANILYTE